MTPACSSCDTEIPPDAARCPRCGTPTVTVQFATPPAPPAAGDSSAAFSLASTLAPGSAPSGGSEPTLPPEGTSPYFSAATLSLGGSANGPSGQPGQGSLQPGQAFGSRYHIKRRVGLGGMGAVYQAWDTELGIDVAIKLIRPEIMSDTAAAAETQRRFKRELLLARLISHKNVVRIHDIGELEGTKYITMSYVDGIDLATLLQLEGRLAVRRVVRLARQICAGLAAAHAAGVVHRDLKPANVMIGANGDAVITDFGIARLTSGTPGELESGGSEAPVAASPHGARYAGFTRVGSMVGTVEYMPPEQARGQPVDQRADVYALGLMLYDMLAGPTRGEHAESPLDELEARTRRALPHVKSVVPEVPEALDEIIARCVEPDPARRFQSSAELAAALDRIDADGKRIPVRSTVGLRRVLGIGAVALAGIAAAWWFLAPKPPPPPKEPVSVVISDFKNATNDAAFDRTLEPVVKVALENADFITAYGRSDVRRALGVQPPDRLDERAARELAVKQGLGVVLSGSIERASNGYLLQMAATQAVTGAVMAKANGAASNADGVLAAAGKVADQIRRELGDDASDATQRFAMETLTATSLDVVHDYAVAMESLASSQFDAARGSFAKAVARDPNFGLAYAGMAIASANLGNQQEAERYVTEAVRHVDRMTERERFRTRGLYYYLTADYPSCVKEYTALIARYKADAAARNNLALCLTRLREMPRALEEIRRAVKILPNRALYRVNLALYAAYAGDFQNAEEEAAKAMEMSPLGFVPLGFARLGLGRVDDAAASYHDFAKVNALGASHAASGLGDLAIYEGRFGEAVRILEKGAAGDVAANNADRAAAKFAAVAYAELSRGRKAAALAAARRALESSTAVKIRFLAGRIYAQAGATEDARKLAEGLATELQAEPGAYARILQGELALAAGNPRQAIVALTEANGLLDTWIGRFTLGRAYVEAGAFAQADSEFDRCVSRRGEALALFLDEEPTYGLFPAVDYYQGRVREGLKTAGFAEAYRRYLAVRGTAGEDPLLPEVRQRAGAEPR
jgi:eukaryotic-like serine/threonine-protein kinase